MYIWWKKSSTDEREWLEKKKGKGFKLGKKVYIKNEPQKRNLEGMERELNFPRSRIWAGYLLEIRIVLEYIIGMRAKCNFNLVLSFTLI